MTNIEIHPPRSRLYSLCNSGLVVACQRILHGQGFMPGNKKREVENKKRESIGRVGWLDLQKLLT